MIGQGRVEFINGNPPRVLGLVFEPVPEHFSHAVENLLGFGTDLGAYPVPREHDDVEIHFKPLKSVVRRPSFVVRRQLSAFADDGGRTTDSGC